MPLYDVQCLDCYKEFEVTCHVAELDTLRCGCGGQVKILLTGTNRDWFHPHINEDFDGTPIEVTSKNHLRELCKKHGVYSRALD